MKALRIAFKDLTVAFRDRTGLILMLAAPVVLPSADGIPP